MLQTCLYRTFYVALACLLCLSAACTKKNSAIEKIKAAGVLHVMVLEGPHTILDSESFPASVASILARQFANILGVDAVMHTATDLASMLTAIETTQVDIALPGIAYIAQPDVFAQGPELKTTAHWQLLYHRSQKKITQLADLNDTEIFLPRTYPLQAIAQDIKPKQNNNITITNTETDIAVLLYKLAQQEIQFVLAHSAHFKYYQHIYPNLRVALNWMATPSRWLYKKSADDSLDLALQKFFQSLDTTDWEQLVAYEHDYLIEFDQVDSRIFRQRILSRLPEYQQMFKTAAKLSGIDWRLLAAISYQESHWDPAAVSPTGVKGLMMLTESAAQDVGIKNRTDPYQSIMGGSIYLQRIISKIPQRIKNPDRTWLALAAYNIGAGHLEDARVITQLQNADPDSWLAVRQRLPLLEKPSWHKRTKHGFAYGKQAVMFVRNIKKYYDMLRLIEIYPKGYSATNEVLDTPTILKIHPPAI